MYKINRISNNKREGKTLITFLKMMMISNKIINNMNKMKLFCIKRCFNLQILKIG
jgi:hypothetical protein